MAVARFEILGVLGTGAEGVVALVRDRADASMEPLALKILQRQAAAHGASLTRLRDEAKILAWLNHPAIVRVHRLLEKDGRPIVVMEPIAGTSTMDLLNHKREGMPAEVALAIATHTARALEAAWNANGPDGHPMRIVHRDVKPANLLLTVDGEVKVVDFGIARGAFEDGESDAGSMGTRGYVAPERRAGAPDAPAVDVYALGVTLFGLLTARLLVQSPREHDASVERATANLDAQGLGAVGALIARMCRQAADERPNLRELVAELEALSPPVDLASYARREVAPLLEERRAIAPADHPAWPEVAFLDEPGDVRDLEIVTPGPPRALALRQVSPPDDVDRLLEALRPRPWWSLWRPDPAPSALVEALDALRGTRDARAISRAHELTRHADPSVVEAAWEVLEAAC
jgi:serine/threonine protein kinase